MRARIWPSSHPVGASWLDLIARRHGVFSGLGPRVEWRGRERDGAFVPDMLVLRYEAWEDPDTPAHGVSYLVPVRLADGTPCVLDFVAPGPDQSVQARAMADAVPACPETPDA